MDGNGDVVREALQEKLEGEYRILDDLNTTPLKPAVAQRLGTLRSVRDWHQIIESDADAFASAAAESVEARTAEIAKQRARIDHLKAELAQYAVLREGAA